MERITIIGHGPFLLREILLDKELQYGDGIAPNIIQHIINKQKDLAL